MRSLQLIEEEQDVAGGSEEPSPLFQHTGPQAAHVYGMLQQATKVGRWGCPRMCSMACSALPHPHDLTQQHPGRCQLAHLKVKAPLPCIWCSSNACTSCRASSTSCGSGLNASCTGEQAGGAPVDGRAVQEQC